MVKLGKHQNDLESFSNAINKPDLSLRAGRLDINKDTVLELFKEAVSQYNIDSILYKNQSLLTFLGHEPVEVLAAPKVRKSKLEQAYSLIMPHVRDETSSILYIDNIAELGHPIAANQDEGGLSDAFIICLFHGENGRSGHFLLSLQRNKPVPSEENLVTLQHYAHIAFLKINDLLTATERAIRLTPRESEMVKFIAKGRSNPEIAEITGLSVHTVNGYLRGIYLKTSTKDRVSLSLYALHKGLLL